MEKNNRPSIMKKKSTTRTPLASQPPKNAFTIIKGTEINSKELKNAVNDAAKNLQKHKRYMTGLKNQIQMNQKQNGGGVIDRLKNPIIAAQVIFLMGILIAYYVNKFKEKLMWKKLYMEEEERGKPIPSGFRGDTAWLYERPVVSKIDLAKIFASTSLEISEEFVNNVLGFINEVAKDIGIHKLATSSTELLRSIPMILYSGTTSGIRTMNSKLMSVYDYILKNLNRNK